MRSLTVDNFKSNPKIAYDQDSRKTKIPIKDKC
uniref:Uncharacterized protein n=1 Tax=Rhizophora mucronata TaxID=61149 RepID=A0A2P2N602_RHIMU